MDALTEWPLDQNCSKGQSKYTAMTAALISPFMVSQAAFIGSPSGSADREKSWAMPSFVELCWPSAVSMKKVRMIS